MTELIDICVNVTNAQFNRDRDAVLARARDNDIVGMLFTASDLDSAREALLLCDGHTRLCTAGIHPHDAKDAATTWKEDLRVLAQDPHVRAVGECGLDFNRSFSPHDVQIDVFEAQIQIAKELGKPLFVHDRDSGGAVLRCLANHHRLPPVVIHCFTGTRQELTRYINEGHYIGVTGWLCDTRRGASLRDMVPLIPLQRLLVETDAPFLKPHNAPRDFYRSPGSRAGRNEPALLSYVVACLAEARNETFATVADATSRNARSLFGFA